MRRSRHDMAMGRHLEIGHRWRSRMDGRIWRVIQIHRKDCVVELAGFGMRVILPFAYLRTEYVWIADRDSPSPRSELSV